MEIYVPPNIKDYFARLYELMERYPDVIRLEDAAEFLRITPQRLRNALMSGVSYGYGWKINSRSDFYISSQQFYMNCTQDWARAGVLKFGGDAEWMKN